MRHSLAHVMASAVQHIWPEAKFGVGPVVQDGFYYDVDLGEAKLSEEDFATIETEMHSIIGADEPFERFEMDIDEAIDWAKQNEQPYKLELLNDLKRAGTTIAKELDAAELGLEAGGKKAIEKVSFYRNGDFTDLCRGPHLASTGKIGSFKLMRVSGAYWRGDEHRPQMQRIYGVAFEAEADLKEYLEKLEQARQRDHRKLGQELGIFMHSDLVGAGLPLLLPNGETIKHELIEYMRGKEQPLGYRYVSTPVLAHEELYKRSGHAQFYADDMYKLADDEGQTFYIKPMNCPHHHMIYEYLVKSYRDLPLKLAEATGLYRKELSGTLTGLIRVRGPISQNDAHIYVTPDMLKAEFLKVLDLFKEVYDETGVEDYWFRLSLPDFDKGKYEGDRKVWDDAAKVIREALQESGVKFVEAEGEAAFYGPKLDVQIKNVLGKEDTIATSQVDILVPHRMKLTYIDEDGQDKTPIAIHRSLLGSYERFIAFLLEQTAGRLPVWLAPEQVRLVTVNQEKATVGFAEKMAEQANELKVRLSIDGSNESVGKKIRDAELMKVPYTVVIGEKEIESGQLMPRVRQDLEVGDRHDTRTVEEFLKTVANEAKSRVSKTSL